MRLYVYIACALALAGFLAYGAHIVKKANRAEAAESALVAERHNHAAIISQIEKEAAASLLERKALLNGLTEIARRFNEPAPPPKTLVKYAEKPGETCPVIGVSDQFVVHYNAASQP